MQRKSQLSLATNKQYNDLLNIMLEQAESFLSELGGFYPFGTTVDTDEVCIPLGLYLDSEITASKAIDIISIALEEKISDKTIIAAALGADVNFRINLHEEMQQAINIKLSHIFEDPLDYYFIYSITNGKVNILKTIYY